MLKLRKLLISVGENYIKRTFPLSGSGKQIDYEYANDGFDVTWGKSPFHVPNSLIDDILKNFFIDKNK